MLLIQIPHLAVPHNSTRFPFIEFDTDANQLAEGPTAGKTMGHGLRSVDFRRCDFPEVLDRSTGAPSG